MSGQGRLVGWRAKEKQKQDECGIFAPEQTGFTGARAIPICSFRLQSGLSGYNNLMESRWKRARAIASKLVGPHEVPVTPLINPRSGESYHVINVINSWRERYAVDILVRDTDSYIVAFRRQHLHEDGEWHPGTWYRYEDVKDLPKEIEDNAISLPFKSSHNKSSRTKPGGLLVMLDMFEVLSTFEDAPRDKKGRLLNQKLNDRVQEALSKAIIIFSEAFRLRSIYLAICDRIRNDDASSEIDENLWLLLHEWGLCSTEILGLCAHKPLPELQTDAPAFFKDIKVRRAGLDGLQTLDTIDSLVGAEGEIMLIRANSALIESKQQLNVLEKRVTQRSAHPVPEPGFTDPLLEPDADKAQ